MTIEMKLFDDLAPSMREAQAFPKMRYRGGVAKNATHTFTALADIYRQRLMAQARS